jgi:hypothetical protein
MAAHYTQVLDCGEEWSKVHPPQTRVSLDMGRLGLTFNLTPFQSKAIAARASTIPRRRIYPKAAATAWSCPELPNWIRWRWSRSIAGG